MNIPVVYPLTCRCTFAVFSMWSYCADKTAMSIHAQALMNIFSHLFGINTRDLDLEAGDLKRNKEQNYEARWEVGTDRLRNNCWAVCK